MSYRLNEREFDAVVELPAKKRFEYFVKRIVDWEQAWALKREGDLVAVEDEGRPYVALWPHREFAAACAIEEWAGAKPEPLGLEALEDLLAQWQAEGTGVYAFPLSQGRGTPVEARFVRDAIGEESESY